MRHARADDEDVQEEKKQVTATMTGPRGPPGPLLISHLQSLQRLLRRVQPRFRDPLTPLCALSTGVITASLPRCRIDQTRKVARRNETELRPNRKVMCTTPYLRFEKQTSASSWNSSPSPCLSDVPPEPNGL
ncbi:hypothetical protein Baya_11430 [Bagarius yarrelli]|uniref:Uncharacterized protein n=1 Tax=Bagarius yarrelli TaxID=175774 RepID=A0A556V119_BAGYA|nr:hypothetical protein Baya_11430 [Bagarius yarrelli]